MSLPSLQKTWLFNFKPGGGAEVASVNQLLPSTGSGQTDYQNLLFKIKDTLINLSDGANNLHANRWVVKGSSNGAGAFGNNDGVDRWATAANLIWNTTNALTNHSWMVLEQTNGFTGHKYQICLDCNSAQATLGGNHNRAMSWRYSPSAGYFAANGGTDGTAIQAPQASDEIVLFGTAATTTTTALWFGGFQPTSFTTRLHVMMSDDGQCTRFFGMVAGVPLLFAVFDKIQNPVTGNPTAWPKPHFGHYRGGLSSVDNVMTNRLWTTASEAIGSAALRGPGTPGTLGTVFLSAEGFGSNVLGVGITTPNDIDTNWPMLPMGVVSQTAGTRGRHGQVFDLWYGSSAVPTGDTYPSVVPFHQFAQFGHVIVPWNQTAPLIS